MKKYTSLGVLMVCFLLGFAGIVHADLKDGLVAYYPFHGNADDESGNGNDGSINGATLTADRFGSADSAYSFDGSNDYIDSNISPSNIGNVLTISAWVYSNTLTGQQSIIASGSIDDENLDLRSPGDAGIFKTIGAYISGDSSGGNQPHGNTNLNEKKWYHSVMCVKSDGSVSIYLNGELEVTETKQWAGNFSLNDADLFIGAKNREYRSDVNQFWNGYIDDVRIYNRTLSETEIRQLYWGAGHTTQSTTTCPTVDDRYDEGYQAGIASCQPNNAGDNCAILEANFDITMPCLDVFGTQLPIGLERFTYPEDPFGYYWKLNLQ